MNLPILRIEIEQIKHNLCLMLSEYALNLDGLLKDSIDKFCTKENLVKIIDNQAQVVIRQEVEKAVTRFFTYGEGSEIVDAVVNARLGKKEIEE